MADIIETIHQDHANLAKLLDAAERQLTLFDAGERPDYEIIQGIVEYGLNYPDLYHHPMEDAILRRLRARDPAAAKAVGDLESEHKALKAATQRFAAAVEDVLQETEVSRDSFVAMARDFIARYRAHMGKEEEVFLPAAARALSASDLAEVEAEMGRREDPLFDADTSERFEALRKKLMEWSRESP